MALWLALACVVFVSFLGRNPQLSTHEARVAETAAAMSRSGWPWSATPVAVPAVELRQTAESSRLQQRQDGATWSVNPWLIPVFEGQIRLQKPPLPYWVTATLFRLFGEGAGVARLPTALLGVVTCGLTYVLARAVAGRRVAIVALALTVSSYFLIDEYRKSMSDPYLACLTLGAIVAWTSASARGGSGPGSVLLFYALLAAASLAKGPVALLHVSVAIVAFSFAIGRRPHVKWFWHLAGIALYLAIALPWPAYIVTHLPTALEVWRFESIGEFADNQRNARPIHFYLPALLLIAAPWTAAWISASVDLWQRRSRRRSFAWLWLIVIVLVFSCSHMKKNAYLLPAVPAITIGAAQGIVRLLAIARRRQFDPAIGWAATAHWIGGVAFAVLICISTFKNLGGLTAAAVGVAAAALALLPLRSLLRRDFERWLTLQAIAFALLISIFLSFPESARRSRKRAAADDAIAASIIPLTPRGAGGRRRSPRP